MIGSNVLPAGDTPATRNPTSAESAVWERFRRQFDTQTSPKVRALVLLAKVGAAAQNEYSNLTGKSITVIDDETTASIQKLGYYAQTIENKINGVLLKKYGVIVGANDLQIVGPANTPESDILQDLFSPTVSGFGIAPILIWAGVAAVTLLGSGFIALKIIEKRSHVEALKITYNLTKLNASMAKESPEVQKTFSKWQDKTSEQVKAAAKSIPGAEGLLSKFLGSKATSIAIAGLLAIAAAYFLIPQLRKN